MELKTILAIGRASGIFGAALPSYIGFHLNKAVPCAAGKAAAAPFYRFISAFRAAEHRLLFHILYSLKLSAVKLNV